MRIHIVTYHNVYNYGAMLQAYGLQKKLQNMRYDVDFLNVAPPKKSIYDPLHNWKKMVKNLMVFRYHKSLLQGRRNCDTFVQQYLNEVEYPTQIFPEDVYLSGSDQVWNPLSGVPEFFLGFVPDHIKKISYAASIGMSDIPADKLEDFQEKINRFQSISVRESRAKELVGGLTDKHVHQNIDPVFLLSKEEWKQLEKPISIKHKYILVYVLYQPQGLNEELKKLKEQTGYKIVVVGNFGYRNIFHDLFIRYAGPQEFIYLIRNAEMVVSSSFHGVAMSIVMEKEFLAWVNPSSPSRIESLLSLFGLQDRIVTSLRVPEKRIDYQMIQRVKEKEVKKAEDYLQQSIEG